MTDKFYLGKLFNSTQGKVTDQPLLYDPADLTTHAVVTGMTGSGKTGLCIAMMEEAALQGIPAILIDPKGDLTNLLLHFPELTPQDFQPWLDPEIARRAGKSIEQASNDAALAWRNGLAEWGIPHERILAPHECGRICCLYSRFGCRPPCQRIVLSGCARLWIGPATVRSWVNGFPAQ